MKVAKASPTTAAVETRIASHDACLIEQTIACLPKVFRLAYYTASPRAADT